MPLWDARDRLAVWSYEQAGEKIPQGHPSVSDAERAAAGRETLAALRDSILPENRSRAAAQYAAGGLPDGQEMMRVWRARDPAGLRDRLGEQTLAVWAEDDVLHVLWRGEAEEVLLGGGLQPRLWPVEGTDDLWEASLRIRRLDEAVISVMVMARRADGDWPVHLAEPFVWRGQKAPAAPADQPLRGTIDEHTLDSAALRASRQVTVYRPPGPARPLAGCVLADGESTTGMAGTLDAAIVAGACPRVLLVGVHNAARMARSWPDRRSQEYLPGVSRRRFDAHMRFVTGEVVGWAAGEFGAVDGPWISAGFSNGAAWAIAAAQRHPEVFAAVAAFSVGIAPKRISGQARSAVVRHYLAAGRLEPGFRRATREWANRLVRAGLPCRHEEWAGGHDPLWWERQLPVALAWLLSPA